MNYEKFHIVEFFYNFFLNFLGKIFSKQLIVIMYTYFLYYYFSIVLIIRIIIVLN